MASVMAFGTFDTLHKGHEYFLRKASLYGDLTVVVARDGNVTRLKGRKPDESEEMRLLNVSSLPFVRRAVLGGMTDLMEIIQKEKPDVICLGYDQDDLGLKGFIRASGKKIIVKRIDPFEPNRYKSSIIRKRAE